MYTENRVNLTAASRPGSCRILALPTSPTCTVRLHDSIRATDVPSCRSSCYCCCCRLVFSAKRLAATNVSEMTRFLSSSKLLVAVTRERRYGPSRLRVNDDDDEQGC